ncbi:MAG TPA: hypothetical protein VEL28_08845 [Candidatus Binatia bacterium]|nr:hypothetical protein [Candidatus Binatia bacterium]
MRPRIAASNVFVALVLACTPAFAGSTSSGVCERMKFAAAGRSASLLLLCHGRTAGSGIEPSARCTERAAISFERRFAAAEDFGGCDVDGEADAMQVIIAGLADDLAAILDPGSGKDRCAALKLKFSARTAAAYMDCHAEAALAQVPVAQGCIDEAASRLSVLFQRVEENQTCTAVGDADDVEDLIESFAVDVSAEIYGIVAGPHPTNLVAVVDDDEIDLTWTHPDPDEGLSHARVLRRLDAAPTDPQDPAATEVFFGVGEAAADDLTALLPDTSTTPRTYHYAVYACTPSGQCDAAGSHDTVTPSLVQALQGGGYVIHWRHSSADVCADSTGLGTAATTSSPNWWRTCDSNCATTTARQLNTTGRNESVAIGDALAARGITIGRVVSSEFCRNFETAALMDFGPVVEESPLITFFVYDEANRCTNSYDFLEQVPAAGTNTALIGHAGFPSPCAVLGSLAWAEAAIFKPDGMGGTTFVARVLGNEWVGLP